MLYASDFRARARQALSGKWLPAVIAGLILSLLSADGPAGPQFNLHFELNQLSGSIEMFGHTVFSASELGPTLEVFGKNVLSLFDQRPALLALLIGNAVTIVLAVLLSAVVFGVIGAVVRVGYARFNLAMVDGFPADLTHLVEYFPRWKTAFWAHFLRSLYTLLWTLLFLIPGILARYNYAMMDYILADFPELTAGEALERSKQLMYGNRWRFFCLQFSFIGWSILASLTWGIGHLWLRPYRQAAYAAFYRSLR